MDHEKRVGHVISSPENGGYSFGDMSWPAGKVAVLVPCLLPPPAPFKIFMLLAGVAGISLGRFIVAIVIGRVIRFFALGMLAVRFGDGALQYVEANQRAVSLGLLGAILAGSVAYVLWTKARARKAR